MIRLEYLDVAKFYGDVLGVMGVSLAVEPGVTGLLGPNGAGKSTLIRLAAGLLCPDQGDVRVEGRSTWASGRLGFLLGYVPDGDALPDFLTGRAFLLQLLRFHGYAAREAARRAEAALERVGLGGVLRRRLGGYSKGMRQRLKLAQALAHDPPLLILDEPLTGLDPIGRRDVIRLVRDLGAAGRTVLVSSHILHEVEAMTDRVALLRHGRLVAAGRIAELRSGLPSTPYRVRATVRDPRPLAARLVVEAGVAGVRVEGTDTLLIETAEPDTVLAWLSAAAARGEAAVRTLDLEDRDLEALFRYTVDR
ncbi:MAG: ABC transporter ATP-binding protein [Planctomycetes bacterium]|nr:ABC transporter ATP-binding protein [Planctomycetota bacterium]